MDRDSEDLLLGKKALDRKLISNSQLKDALIEQARSRTPSGSQHQRLGDVLVARNFTSRDKIQSLQEENERIVSGPAAGRDSALGRILVENGTISSAQLQDCLRAQDEALRGGETPEPRVGELLVRKGYASAEAVRRALAVQEKTILACVSCGKRCNGAGYDPSRKYLCTGCKAELRPVASPGEVSVQHETQDVPLSSSPQPGRLLGKYTIVREVGRGGMGVVFEALDTVLDRKVALKMLVIQLRADTRDVRQDEERFLREARLSAQLPSHPNVVGVYEAGILDGNRYLAMEFIDGVPMVDWWKDKSIRLRTQVTVLRDAILGVHHAHQHGVIHRDLKPENILIDREGQPHITDFGLAKEMQQSPKDALTGKGMVVGSPHYMSPEQVRGLRVDRRADVYSMGVILYEMFTGRRPFDGGSPEEIMLKALQSKAPSPSSIMRSQMNPILHRSLENVCLKAIAKDPKERYVSAEALADDLSRWLQGEEIQVNLPRQRKRQRSLILAAAGAALLMLAGLGLAFLGPSLLERELQSAAELARRGDDSAARATYEAILSRWPGQKEAVAGREDLRRRETVRRLDEADALLTQGRPSDAFDAFTRVLLDYPQERRAQEGRDEAKRRMIAGGGSEGKADPKRP